MANNKPNFDDLWDYNDPAATEQKFRELLPIAEQSDDPGYHAELLTQIARTYGLRQQFEEAHKLLDTVEEVLTDDLRRARIRYCLERGRTFNSAGERDAARPLFVEAWESGQQAGEDALAVDAAHMIAIVEEGDEALAWNLKAVAAAEASSHERANRWLGSLYNNIGWTYFDMEDYGAALSHFEKALNWQQANGTPEKIRIAQWCIARTHRAIGRVEEALAIQQQLLQEYDAIDEKPGYTYEELGECLLLLDRAEEAKPYFKLAYDELSKDIWLTKNEPERLQRLKEMGE